jgi:hypothetical protein
LISAGKVQLCDAEEVTNSVFQQSSAQSNLQS